MHLNAFKNWCHNPCSYVVFVTLVYCAHQMLVSVNYIKTVKYLSV